MRFAKGLKVALYGGDTLGSVSSVRGCYWVSPLWLILLFMTLGNSLSTPPSCLSPPVSPLQIPRKNETLWNNLQLRWILHIVPFSLSHSLPFSSISANRPKGRISAVSQVSAQALWKGWALLNGPVVGEVRGECVSLVNRALWDVTVWSRGAPSFHSFSHVIPQHDAVGAVVRSPASLGSACRYNHPTPLGLLVTSSPAGLER